MNLEKIRKLSENRGGGMRKLASDAGMSEANLHRCVNNNRIGAGDLEKIAMLLGVPIDIFFNEESQPSASATASGRNSVAAAGQGISVTHTSSPAGGENTALQEKVSSLEDQIALLKASLADKERTIQILMQNR